MDPFDISPGDELTVTLWVEEVATQFIDDEDVYAEQTSLVSLSSEGILIIRFFPEGTLLKELMICILYVVTAPTTIVVVG